MLDCTRVMDHEETVVSRKRYSLEEIINELREVDAMWRFLSGTASWKEGLEEV